MSQSFIERYNNIKLAGGPMDILRQLQSGAKAFGTGAGKFVSSPTFQTTLGAGGGIGLSLAENHANPNMTTGGKEVNMGINAVMGALMGNPAARRSGLFSSWQRNATGRSYAPDLKKWLTASTLWGAKGLGIASWDKVNQTLGNVAGATGKAEKGVADVIEKITGMKPDETDLDAAARRQGPIMLGSLRETPDGIFKLEGKHPAARLKPALEAVDRWFQNQKATGGIQPQDEAGWGNIRDRLAERVVDSRDAMDPATIIENMGKGVETLRGAVGGAAATLQDPAIQKGLHSLGHVGDLAENLNQHGGTILKGTGLALGGGLAAVGGYNLLRDKLNYNRVRSEREAKQRGSMPMQPKLAALPGWLGTAAKWVVPAAMGGGEWYLNRNEDPLVQAVAGASGFASGRLMSGGLKIKSPSAPIFPARTSAANRAAGLAAHDSAVASVEMKNKLLGLAKPPAAVMGLALPRALSHLMNSNSGMKLDQAIKPLAYGGAAVAGGGLLYLLNKWINKDPAPAPATTVFAGGTGGPDNPNVGGKIRVTLPTKKPGDHETTVEVPMENIGLPNSMFANIRRDTKRRLRQESDIRAAHRSPDGTLITPKLAALLNRYGRK